MLAYEPWMEYVVHGDEGGWVGVRDDAPDWAKAAWTEYAKAEEEARNSDQPRAYA